MKVDTAVINDKGTREALGKQVLLSVEDMDITYGKGAAAIRGISFTISPGEVLAIVGESGSGKTSIIRALLGCISGDGQVGSAHHEIHVGDGVVKAGGAQLLLGHLRPAPDALGIGLAEGQVAGGVLVKEGVVVEKLLVADGAVVGHQSHLAQPGGGLVCDQRAVLGDVAAGAELADVMRHRLFREPARETIVLVEIAVFHLDEAVSCGKDAGFHASGLISYGVAAPDIEGGVGLIQTLAHHIHGSLVPNQFPVQIHGVIQPHRRPFHQDPYSTDGIQFRQRVDQRQDCHSLHQARRGLIV